MLRRKRDLRLVPRALPAHLSENPEDRAREQRIADLSREYARAAAAGSTTKCLELWNQLKTEIASRSPAQIVRMEAAKGLRR